MSEPIKRSCYWLFDEQQLEDALAEYHESVGKEPCDSRPAAEMVRDFLDSKICTDRGMRRGGTDDS